MKLPSPRIDPASEQTSPLKAMSLSSSVPRLTASCSATRPVRFSRSIASGPRLNLPLEPGQSIRPRGSNPRSSATPTTPKRAPTAVDPQLGGPPLAPHQRTQAELDVELVGANLAEIVVAADHH